jgi:hypothetical protein
VKISETLYKAAEHIEMHGWHQGYFWPHHDRTFTFEEPPYTDGDPCCAIGAIGVVEGVDPANVTTDAMEALKTFLGFDFISHVPDWNDSKGRTREEVLAALRGAALRAEKAGR